MMWGRDIFAPCIISKQEGVLLLEHSKSRRCTAEKRSRKAQ
jgi:hypothetical protein